MIEKITLHVLDGTENPVVIGRKDIAEGIKRHSDGLAKYIIGRTREGLFVGEDFSEGGLYKVLSHRLHEGVSRRHIGFEVSERGGVGCYDLHSTNGTTYESLILDAPSSGKIDERGIGFLPGNYHLQLGNVLISFDIE